MPKLLFILCLFFLSPFFAVGQADTLLVADSAGLQINGADSLRLADSIPKKPTVVEPFTLRELLSFNSYTSPGKKPKFFIHAEHNISSRDGLFYLLALTVALFALLKFLYSRYFSNLFRVFFNTSLRQGQLTDQLLQAKLPSLLFNIFFLLIGGWYLYLLLIYFDKIEGYANWQVLLLAIGGLMIVYVLKFMILKFTGWVTGYRNEADTYIFIVFLINKIVAICLIPLVIIMAFSEKQIAGIALVLSYLIIGLMILMRFIRSYSLLQHRLKVSRFHFLIYITGIEIIPLLVIYKAAILFIGKNL
jgi:Domain of unknown function (DUF4271)